MVALHGTDKLHSLAIRNSRDEAVRDIRACAVFVMTGAKPNTTWLSDMVELDKTGFVLTERRSVPILHMPPRDQVFSPLATSVQGR
jgi:thioredoxin reductase (NADPH)